MTRKSVIGKKDIISLDERLRSKNTVVLLHATWCIHCQMFASQWDALLSKLAKKKDLQMFSIESEVLQAINDKKPSLLSFLAKTPSSPDLYFPKIMVFVKGNKAVRRFEYTGDRNADALEKFINSKI